MTRSVIKKGKITLNEQEQRTVYKLYKDTINKPKKTQFLKPIILGAGFAVAGGSIDLISDVDIVGKLLIFLGASLVAVSLIEYKKQKNQFRLSKKRLDKFKEL